MDKIESAVVFILALLVTIGPLGMLADLLWRRREEDRYIVEIWNADHTRLITTIVATSDSLFPPTGERVLSLDEGLEVASQDPIVEAQCSKAPGRGDERNLLELVDKSQFFRSGTPVPRELSTRGASSEQNRLCSFTGLVSPV